MAKQFEFNFRGNVDELISKASKLAKQNGIDFSGDTTKGTVCGLGVEGCYEIVGKTIKITINKKPLLAPWSMLQHKLANLIYEVQNSQKS